MAAMAAYERNQAQLRVMDINFMTTELENAISKYPELKPLNESVKDYGTLKWAHSRASAYVYAKNLEIAGRFEESARTYEQLGMYHEAGRVRGKSSSQTIRHVSVNLNDLIEKLRYGGLAIPYKCNSCGATITIDENSSADGLRSCSFCGAAVNTDALVRILQDAVGGV